MNSFRTTLFSIIAAAMTLGLGCAGDDAAPSGHSDSEDSQSVGQGSALYTRNTIDPPLGLSIDTAALLITGDSAVAMFNDMTGALVVPAAPDLEDRHPSQIQLGDTEGRIGRHVICRKRPRISPDGVELERDDAGDVIYEPVCVLDYDDHRTGTLLDHTPADQAP